MTDIPTFDFSGCSVKDNEELEKELKKGSIVRPGSYEAAITKVEAKGASESDNTWYKYTIFYGLVGDREIRDTIMIPTTDVKFKTASGKGEFLPFKKLQEIGRAHV